jgi:RNA polymerase sigma factor (sigma-70 family)
VTELAQHFEDHRPRLRAMAYRMLGSLTEADDAVQEAWLRLSRSSDVDDLGAWLTTVVTRICLNMLRARREVQMPEPIVDLAGGVDPEHEALVADSVGLAMLVVLETLSPPERVAFVLHDVFAVPFDEIARMLDRSPDAARQLASRARRRVRGATPDADLAAQREVVDAFLAAARDGDFDALVAVLDPDIVLRVDGAPVARGPEAVAKRARGYARLDLVTRPVLVNGAVGGVATRNGEPFALGAFTVREGRIVAMDFVTDRERLRRLQP